MTHGLHSEGLTGAGARRLVESGLRVAVVGAGGWMGLASLDLLHRLLGPATFGERVVAFGSQARILTLAPGTDVVQRPLAELGALPPQPTIVLHFAFLTQEKAKVMSEADYVAANLAISRQVLDALDPIDATGVFLPSSGATYMVHNLQAQASMRLYGRLKLDDEAAVEAWAQRGARKSVIARVFNLSGPYINKQSSYALACFIADALADRPIHVKATRPVYRSYVAISELMSVVFGLLTDDEAGSILFDTAGDHDYEMAQIASVVAQTLARERGIERPALESVLPDRYLGNGQVYRRLRRKFGVTAVDMHAQILTTASTMVLPRRVTNTGGPAGQGRS